MMPPLLEPTDEQIERSWTQSITRSDPDHKISIKIVILYLLSIHLEMITLTE